MARIRRVWFEHSVSRAPRLCANRAPQEPRELDLDASLAHPLDVQPTAAELRDLARRDPVLGRAMKRLPRFPGFPGAAQRAQRTHFHALARAILFQQLHWKAATTIHDRVVGLTPGAGFPSAKELLALDSSALRSAGVSSNKERALRDLARRVSSTSRASAASRTST